MWTPTADFCSFRYTFDQNTLLKTSQTIRKCAQECSSEQMGFKVLKVAMYPSRPSRCRQKFANLPKHMERSNMAAVGSKKQMGFRCIHVMIISKYTFVEFLNEMESRLRILDCGSFIGKCLHAFGRRLNDYNSAAARNYAASANEMNALLSGSKGKFLRLPSYFIL